MILALQNRADAHFGSGGRQLLARLLAMLLLWPAAWSSASARDLTPVEVDGVSITTKVVMKGLEHPLFAVSPPGDNRLFVIEKRGWIKIIKDGKKLKVPFLDLSSDLRTEDERGLLGIAFDPDFASNGRFYIDYTPNGPGSVVIAQGVVSADPNVADVSSLRPIVTIDHPNENHNGGWLAFGPDGDLYVAVGDGGGANDLPDLAQNPATLYGKILRIDVRAGTSYAIPPDNPFVHGGGAPEVFAYGLRNPWRASFDGATLYIADVGQDKIEELNILPLATPGLNYGWHVLEGDKCLAGDTCDQAGMTMPIYTYTHDDGSCSIVGGYVYRGKAIPALNGRYFFGDYCTGRVRSLRFADGVVSGVQDYPTTFDQNFMINSFSLDKDGEILILLDSGVIEQIVPAPSNG